MRGVLDTILKRRNDTVTVMDTVLFSLVTDFYG